MRIFPISSSPSFLLFPFGIRCLLAYVTNCIVRTARVFCTIKYPCRSEGGKVSNQIFRARKITRHSPRSQGDCVSAVRSRSLRWKRGGGCGRRRFSYSRVRPGEPPPRVAREKNNQLGCTVASKDRLFTALFVSLRKDEIQMIAKRCGLALFITYARSILTRPMKNMQLYFDP